MDEQALLEEIRAMREEMHAMREQMTGMIGDTNKKLEVIGGFVKAMNEAQTFEKTMKAVENVTHDITGGGATFIATEGERFFTTDGENRDYIELDNVDMMRSVMGSGNIRVDGDTAIIPVQANNDQSIGCIIAKREGGFDGVDLSQLAKGSTVMDTISLAIEKELNHSHAITDELTQLKNRDGLQEYLKYTLVPAVNTEQKACILMCDIDHFKAVNDTYGHQAGDAVLKQVAQILSENTRNGIDSPFRVGGEEMLCVVGCDTAKATEIAERIREQIEAAVFSYEGQEIPVTISIGVHEMQEKNITLDNIRGVFETEVKAADSALYEAKESGRNQVVISEESRKREPTYFNKEAYKSIQNKVYIDTDAKTAYEISQAAQHFGVEHSVKYDGKRSSVTLDSVKNSSFLDYVSKSYPMVKISEPKEKPVQQAAVQYQQQGMQNSPTHQASQKKEPTFFNKDAFSQIENKTYVNTDSRTAYDISKMAQQSGVEHSVKYNGSRSTVTVDGVKDRHFLDVVASMTEWAQKVQIKAAQMREQQNRPMTAGAR